MPELPEVETIARQLRPLLTGRTFTDVDVLWPRSVATGAAALRRDLPGQRVEALGRRGKFLVFALSSGASLLVHLRMTGRLELGPAGDEGGHTPGDPEYTRVAFFLDDGRCLRFNDVRKFGRVFLVPEAESVTGALGPEPLAAGFTVKDFAGRLAGRARQLKPLLLDQTFLAGLGNIYVDESLFLARLHPLRRADTLSPAEAGRLYRAIRRTLTTAIAHNGTSFDWVYPGGDHQDRLKVYDRARRPCRRCGTPIVRVLVGQRGTYYCPRCQEEWREG